MRAYRATAPCQSNNTCLASLIATVAGRKLSAVISLVLVDCDDLGHAEKPSGINTNYPGRFDTISAVILVTASRQEHEFKPKHVLDGSLLSRHDDSLLWAHEGKGAASLGEDWVGEEGDTSQLHQQRRVAHPQCLDTNLCRRSQSVSHPQLSTVQKPIQCLMQSS